MFPLLIITWMFWGRTNKVRLDNLLWDTMRSRGTCTPFCTVDPWLISCHALFDQALASVGQYLPLDAACESTIKGEGNDTVNEFVQPVLKEPNQFTHDHLYDPDFGVTDLTFEEGLEDDVLYTYDDASGEMSPDRLGGSKSGLSEEGGTLYLRLEDDDAQFGNTAEV
jgi:hypothetical protein